MKAVNDMIYKAAVGVLMLVAASACTSVRAAKPIERPALEVPPAPPRVIAPLPLPAAIPLVEPLVEAPTNNTPTSPRSRAAREKSEAAKPDPKTETPPPAEPPPATPPAQPAAPVLRLPEGTDNTQSVNQIRASIGNTRSILEKTDANSLKTPLQNAYKQATLFVKEAEAALKTGNLVYAKETAEKAERLAKELQNR